MTRRDREGARKKNCAKQHYRSLGAVCHRRKPLQWENIIRFIDIGP